MLKGGTEDQRRRGESTSDVRNRSWLWYTNQVGGGGYGRENGKNERDGHRHEEIGYNNALALVI